MTNNHYGYARMPRIIRKGYKELTNMQKLLYIYLRDLCGEHGTCYRSLRALAEETDFSTGYLSESIPLLVQAGLIIADKKKHNGQKWEVWHISIVDIWEKNAQFIQGESVHAMNTNCSPHEQNQEKCSLHEHKSPNCSYGEQLSTESVHNVNENGEKCSRGAYKEESTLNKNPLLTEKVRTCVPPALPPEQQKWFDEVYCGSKIAPVPPIVTETLKKHVVLLSRYIRR